MIRITLVSSLLFLLSFTIAKSQFAWVNEYPGSDNTGAQGLVIDSDNNLYVVGNFNNGINLGGTLYTGHGSFLLKLTKDGMPLWHKIIRHATSDFWGIDQVGVDNQGNAFIGGMIPQTANIAGVGISGTGTYNSVVAKFDAFGNLIWHRVIDGVQGFFDLKVNSSGQVLVYAQHYDTVGGTHVGQNSFGAMLDASGNILWIKGLGDPSRFNTWPKACALDDYGNAYFHGTFSGHLSIGSKQVESTGGIYDFFFTRINVDGSCEWLSFAERKIPEYEAPVGMIVERGALQVDNTGAVFASGAYWHDMKIGSSILTGASAFLTKLNSDGTFSWATSIPNTTNQTAVDDILLRHGKVYASGTIPAQLFVASYTASGVQQDMVTIPKEADIGNGLAIDSDQKIYMAGRTVSSPMKAFVFKYDVNPVPSDISEININSVCTHGSINASITAIPNAQRYEWEIKYNNKMVTIITSELLLLFSVSEGFKTGTVSLRVRAANKNGVGNFSNWHDVLVKSTPVPELTTSCTQVVLKSEDINVVWYQNGQWADIPATATYVEPHEPGSWYVTVTDECGAETSNVVQFEPLSAANIFIPNIITPNGDNWNDTFVLDGKLLNPNLSIFNRWGNEVFSSPLYNNNWNGEDLPVGVYFYHIYDHCLDQPIVGPIAIAR